MRRDGQRDVGLRGGFLDEDSGCDQLRGRPEPADRKVFDRTHRLDAAIGIIGNGVFAQRITFDPGHHQIILA